MTLPKIQDIDVAGKRVLVRADLDVPLQELRGESSELGIADDTRLKAGLETIEYLLNNNAKVVVIGHVGRPKGIDPQLSLEPVALWFFEQFKVRNSELAMHETKLGDFDGWELDENFYVLENLRFWKEEEANDTQFAKQLASIADIYVNDAITVAHRNHASVTGIAKVLPHYVGLHLQKEIEVLGGVLEDPKRPLVVIIGGAKIETKLPLVAKMNEIADSVLVGGKLPLEVQSSKFKVQNLNKVLIAELNAEGTDITEESIKKFKEVVATAEMIVWNGPMGLMKSSEVRAESSGVDTEKGTREVAQAVVESKAYKIVGGGDTIDCLKNLGLLDQFDFVSMGGGAMLAFLSGEKLPGIEVLIT